MKPPDSQIKETLDEDDESSEYAKSEIKPPIIEYYEKSIK